MTFSPLRLSYATKAALLVMSVALLLALGLSGEYYMITSNYNQTVAHSNSQWCDTLDLLTMHEVPKPVDPKANPSRVGQYQLYEDFVQLKDRFGCR